MTYLESVLARERLVAVLAGEWLDSQMNTLMSLQIVIAVEGLWALIALERPVVLWRRLLWVSVRRTVIHAVHVCCMSTVESEREARAHGTIDQLHLTIRILHVRENRARKTILTERTLVSVR